MMESKSEGLFYSANIPQGIYGIIKLYTKKESGSSWASLTLTASNMAYKIEIVNGKVNNLGIITWDFVGNAGGERGYGTLDYNRDYIQVRNLFQEKNSSSNWNQKEWINNGINQANSSVYSPPASYTPPAAPVVQPSPTRSVTGVFITKSISLNIGASETLTATIIPTNATNKNVTWTSSNANVVRVSNGTITAVAAGTATITLYSRRQLY